jgi:hypothetical protein
MTKSPQRPRDFSQAIRFAVDVATKLTHYPLLTENKA